MQITIRKEAGYEEALLGLSLNRKKDPQTMHKVLTHLAPKDKGHNKVLRFMSVWLDIKAPMYFWTQFDTYKVGVSTSSESTMNTLLDRPLVQEDFQYPIPQDYLKYLNMLVTTPNISLEFVKSLLPAGFLQRRIICTNYQALKAMIDQRKKHKLLLWKEFCSAVMEQVSLPEFLGQ